jgi:hypothetical protein
MIRDITLLKQRMDKTEWHMRDSVYAIGEPKALLMMTVFGFQPKARRRFWEAIRRRIPIGFNRNIKEEQ